MTTLNRNWWMKNQENPGIWEHRGKVAVAGVGHSPTDRRWDGENLETSLGAYSILAAKRAMDDAGVSPDEIDGVISSPGPLGDFWAPRPYFDPPYDSEDGLTKVTAEWLSKELGLKNVKYLNSNAPQIGEMVGLAAQAVGDGLCSTCLVLYPTGNLPGRYHHQGENESDYAYGNNQWQFPWGHQNGFLQGIAFIFNQYCRKYGATHDGIAPFAVNQRRNGLRFPLGYYAMHEPYQITESDYLNARWVAKPVSLLDCDRPVQASACYLITTSDKAKQMKQKPVYILSHSENNYKFRSTYETLDNQEEWCEAIAKKVYQGSGLTARDIDVFNPYDGFLLFTQLFLEGFNWHGVTKGESHAFYAGDITSEGPHPFLTSGGNSGTGRTRCAIITDCIEQLQGRAGERQITIRCETALTGSVKPSNCGWVVFSKHPD